MSYDIFGWIIFVEDVISSNWPSSLSFVAISINVLRPGSIRSSSSSSLSSWLIFVSAYIICGISEFDL